MQLYSLRKGELKELPLDLPLYLSSFNNSPHPSHGNYTRFYLSGCGFFLFQDNQKEKQLLKEIEDGGEELELKADSCYGIANSTSKSKSLTKAGKKLPRPPPQTSAAVMSERSGVDLLSTTVMTSVDAVTLEDTPHVSATPTSVEDTPHVSATPTSVEDTPPLAIKHSVSGNF